jgi:DNA-binding MarR family transcriptional regulator
MRASTKPEITARRSRMANPEETAFLDLVRTTELLSRPAAQLLKTEDLSPAQYNVLRILRGSPQGLTCREIGSRMITRDPDITRLLDRLEKRLLISRNRDDKDRRVVLTRITGNGLDLLARLDQPIQDLHRRLLGPLGPERLQALAQILEACRNNLS